MTMFGFEPTGSPTSMSPAQRAVIRARVAAEGITPIYYPPQTPPPRRFNPPGVTTDPSEFPIMTGTGPLVGGGALSLIAKIIAALGIGYTGFEALGGGKGGGLFGLNILGGDETMLQGPGGPVPLGGPGLAEPPAAMVAKEWSTGTAQFYMLIDGRIAVYSKKKRRWKLYRPAKHIVVPKNPRIGTLLRADRRIDKLMGGLAKRMPKTRRRGHYSRYQRGGPRVSFIKQE